MTRKISLIWTAGIFAVAGLNVLDVLPDWTTIAAVLTLPLMAAASANRRCGPR